MEKELRISPALAPGLETANAIQSAIDEMAHRGGGRISLMAGEYVSTTLMLRNGIDLHLERGAVLKAHTILKDYPEVGLAASNKDQSRQHLIVAWEVDGVSISGDGIIDGQDQAFWEPCQKKEDRPYGIFRYLVIDNPRNRPSPLVQIVKSSRVSIRDVTITSPPGWGLHIFESEDVSIQGITVIGDPYGPNTDGIGINASRRVKVHGCRVDTGDDAIIVKATNPGSLCESVVVSDCVVASNCAGLGLGADVEGTVRDILFNNCVVEKSLRMMQVEMWFAGTVERAIFSNITGRTLPDEEVANERPIYVDIQQFIRKDKALGIVRDLIFRDIICESRGRILLTAQDGAKIENLSLNQVSIRVPEVEDPELSVPASTSLQLSNHSPESRTQRAGVVADNIKGLNLQGVSYHWPKESQVPMNGLFLRNVEGLNDQSPALISSEPDFPRAKGS
jgi:polygalacturonase